MKRLLHISAEFDCVFLLNGHFFEELDVLEVEENEMMYLTVLPLKAALLPYTTQLMGGIPQTNRELVTAYLLPRSIADISLKPRFNYVYTPQGVALRNASTEKVKNAGVRLFWHIKNSQFKEARALLAPALNQSLTDAALTSFFADYSDALSNRYYCEFQNSIILIDNTLKGNLFQLSYNNGLIDNITKIDI